MKGFLIIGLLLLVAVTASAQTAANDPWPGDRRRPDEESEFIKKMLAKQQTEREKREYAELIERGETALKMSEQLEEAFATKDQLSDEDLKRLEQFEKIIGKIRDDLGGDDDGETSIAIKDEKPPKDVREGFLYLKQSTEELLSEIKKSTRFSVSVVAIESSNALIRLARFLRLKS